MGSRRLPHHHSSTRPITRPPARITHFGCLDGLTRLTGVTAIPKRTDGIGLSAIFQEIAIEYGIRDMIHCGFLVPIRAWQVQTSIDLRSVKTTAGDYEIVSAYE